MNRKNQVFFMAILGLLFLLSIACQQAGEIISPAEATQRSQATQSADTGGEVVTAEGADFAPGDPAILTSEGHLVGLYQEAGGNVAFSFATRGDDVTVVGSAEVEGELWYKIESTAGNGWLPGSNLQHPE